MLTVLSFHHIHNHKSYWLCQCECGVTTIVRGNRLKEAMSCGCLGKVNIDQTPGPRTCIKCGKEKQFPHEFKARRGPYKGLYGNTCKSCRSIYEKEFRSKHPTKHKDIIRNVRIRNMRNVVEYFNSHPCVDCGETDWLVLQFDHVRGEKSFEISHALCKRSWSAISEEISKCDVRCACCHIRKSIHESGKLRYILDDPSPILARKIRVI